MKNVSNKFLQAINEVRNWQYTVTMDFKRGDFAGQTRYLENADLAINGCEINMSAGTSSLPLGNAIGKTLNLAIMNNEDQWSAYDFFGCEIKVEINYTVDADVTKIVLGYFTVIEPETYGSTIEITAVDKMYKLDVPFDKTKISTPCTLSSLVREACLQGQISFSNNTFLNQTYQIKTIPEQKTCREIVGLCSMIAGGNAIIDDTGRVDIVSYNMSRLYNDQTNLNGGTFDTNTTPYSDGDNVNGGDFTFSDKDVISGGSFTDTRDFHILFKGSKITITTDDVVITGVETTINEKKYSAGTDGYKIGFVNELLEGNTTSAIQDAVNKIGDVLIWKYQSGRYKGLKYRPFEIDHVSLPIVDFADPCYVVDRRQRDYISFITDYTFKFKGYTTIKCSSEAPLRTTSKYTAPETQAIVVAKQLVEAEKSAREIAIQTMQDEINNASGLYETKVNYLPNLPVPNGANLRINFDYRSTTESSVDRLSLYITYEGESRKAVFERKGGTSWSSIVIPYEKKITSMELYWQTDSSVVKWGWKITGFELTNSSVTVTPFSPSYYSDMSNYSKYVSVDSISQLESAHDYTNGEKIRYYVSTPSKLLPNVGSIYVLHNKPNMYESDIWWVATSDVMFVSTDKGRTFNAGVDASGNAVVRHLSASGVSADWITTGEITIGGSGTSAKIVMKNAQGKVIGGWDVDGVEIQSSDKYVEIKDGKFYAGRIENGVKYEAGFIESFVPSGTSERRMALRNDNNDGFSVSGAKAVMESYAYGSRRNQILMDVDGVEMWGQGGTGHSLKLKSDGIYAGSYKGTTGTINYLRDYSTSGTYINGTYVMTGFSGYTGGTQVHDGIAWNIYT